MNEPCKLHIDRPGECPQAHICVCGKPLSEHWSVEVYCTPYGPDGKRFHPNQSTLLRFPEQYGFRSLKDTTQEGIAQRCLQRDHTLCMHSYWGD